jgi:hypothetical protein
MTDNDELTFFGDFNRPTLNFIVDEDNPAIITSGRLKPMSKSSKIQFTILPLF